jgi:hypothetical protein
MRARQRVRGRTPSTSSRSAGRRPRAPSGSAKKLGYRFTASTSKTRPPHTLPSSAQPSERSSSPSQADEHADGSPAAGRAPCPPDVGDRARAPNRPRFVGLAERLDFAAAGGAYERGRSGRRVLDIARKIILMCRERARGSDSSTDPPERRHGAHDLDLGSRHRTSAPAGAARRRRALPARANRSDHNAQARTGYCKAAYAALLARVPGGRSTPGEGGQCAPSLLRGGM